MTRVTTVSDILAICQFYERTADFAARKAICRDMVYKLSQIPPEDIANLTLKIPSILNNDIDEDIRSILEKMSSKLVEYMNNKKRKDGCVIFVHGLGSSHLRTWNGMDTHIRSNDALRKFWDTKCYEYKTFKVKWLPSWLSGKRYLGINTLAKGLRSFIEIHCMDYESIVIVAHSMGGLIAAKFITKELSRLSLPGFSGAMFFATPFLGSQLANIADALSVRHKQVRSMMKESPECLELIECFKM